MWHCKNPIVAVVVLDSDAALTGKGFKGLFGSKSISCRGNLLWVYKINCRCVVNKHNQPMWGKVDGIRWSSGEKNKNEAKEFTKEQTTFGPDMESMLAVGEKLWGCRGKQVK